MFGDNPRSPVRHGEDGNDLPVREIFYTVQGEGPHSGRAALFVRLAGCNLACYFCDTDFDLDKATCYTAVDLVDNVCSRLDDVRSVRGFLPMLVITGGEPLLYNLAPLIELLKARNPSLVIQIETAGSTVGESTANAIVEHHVDVVCSPKTAKVHPRMGRLVTAWKYVLRSVGVSNYDGLPTYSMQSNGGGEVIARPTNGAPVYVQPCDMPGEQRLNARAVAIVSMRHGHTASVQLHKILELE